MKSKFIDFTAYTMTSLFLVSIVSFFIDTNSIVGAYSALAFFAGLIVFPVLTITE